ncbi:hypothetical protein [Actinomadura harenae]|uniref:Uncharacterized protein n=1 Tax=Actinomadura harenae TaxID=2483351 RepID=A0A3M2M810_9ACTN|nr:hypothetical protein [Actinomadura harenae]RMI45746.1 hypothetical protein EBO15_09155 [Actinomadura harenae]
MRRIATVAVTTGALAAGLLVSAGAANADQGFSQSAKLPTASGVQAAASHSWVSKNGWSTIKAYGTYNRTKSGVKVSFSLADTKRNGWSPAVQFRTSNGKYLYTSGVYYLKYRGVPADFKFSHYYGVFTSSYTKHLYVREAGVSVKNTKKIAYGPWKALY